MFNVIQEPIQLYVFVTFDIYGACVHYVQQTHTWSNERCGMTEA